MGDLVYARVTAADRDLDPVLACTDAQGKVCSSAMCNAATMRSISNSAVALLFEIEDSAITAWGVTSMHHDAVALLSCALTAHV